MNPPFPNRGELLAAVHEFLLRLRPHLAGEDRYQAQVAAYLLEIVRREDGSRAPVARPDELAAFRDDVRAGRLDADADLAETLLLQAATEVRIVRPDHLDPIHREEPT